MPRPDSVLATQEPVLKLERQIREAKERLERLQARLEKAVEAHREQIKRSLDSAIPEERQMAQNVAVWWGVLPPPDEPQR